jgi:UDP-N-acetylglucosamine 2-epimerase
MLGRWLDALSAVDRPVLFPVHPRTRALISKHGLEGHVGPALRLAEPLGYFSMLAAETEAAAVLTDSGGVQKEAYVLGVPCVTLRPETEWVETLERGWNRLCPDPQRLSQEISRIAPVGRPPPVYGDGRAAELIAGTIASCLR